MHAGNRDQDLSSSGRLRSLGVQGPHCYEDALRALIEEKRKGLPMRPQAIRSENTKGARRLSGADELVRRLRSTPIAQRKRPLDLRLRGAPVGRCIASGSAAHFCGRLLGESTLAQV